jgi:hypothetical protein
MREIGEWRGVCFEVAEWDGVGADVDMSFTVSDISSF